MRRSGPKDGGQFQRISWDEALAEIKTPWSDIIARCRAQAIMPRPTSGVRSSATITLIIPSAQCPARAEVDANVPVRLLRRAVHTVSIRTILVPFLRALRMNGRAWRFVGNRRSSYILIALPTATFGMSYLRIFN
jgi:anaerobic selenocysteine-containing dehydrogenase